MSNDTQHGRTGVKKQTKTKTTLRFMYNSKNPKPLTLGEDREEWLEKILQTTANNGVVGPCPVPRSWAWPMGQDQGHPSNVALWGELARPTQPWWQLGLRPLLRNTHPHSTCTHSFSLPHPPTSHPAFHGPWGLKGTSQSRWFEK